MQIQNAIKLKLNQTNIDFKNKIYIKYIAIFLVLIIFFLKKNIKAKIKKYIYM
jgi:hypothetical protein